MKLPGIVEECSRSYANGGEVLTGGFRRPDHLSPPFDHTEDVPKYCYIRRVKIWIRLWDGRRVWGGKYIMTFF